MSPLRALARLQPLGQERIRVERCCAVVGHGGLVEQALQLAIAPRVEGIGGSADMLAADEHLRQRLRAGAIREHAANAAAEILFLELDGVDVDAAIRDAKLLEQLAHRPAEFAPLERKHDHWFYREDFADEL